MATSNRSQAPKGGITIMGVFYKGGQFLPDFAPAEESSKSKSNKVKLSDFDVEFARLQEYLSLYNRNDKNIPSKFYNCLNLFQNMPKKMTDANKRKYTKLIRFWMQ